jgi:hypothetical protein
MGEIARQMLKVRYCAPTNLLLAALRQFNLPRSFAMTTLRQRVLEDMSIRNLAENTKLSNLQQVSLYAKHFDRSPARLNPGDHFAYCHFDDGNWNCA